jgi:hypothetical protein
MYIIVDDNNAIMRIGHVPLFGHKVELLACFYKETDALKILFELENGLDLKGHRVENTGDAFFVEPDSATK